MKINSSRSSEIFDEFIKNYSRYKSGVDAGTNTRISKIDNSSRVVKTASVRGLVDMMSAAGRNVQTIAGVRVAKLGDVISNASRMPLGAWETVIGTGGGLPGILQRTRIAQAVDTTTEAGQQLAAVKLHIAAFEQAAKEAVRNSDVVRATRTKLEEAFPGGSNSWIDGLIDGLEEAYVVKSIDSAGLGKSAEQIMDETIDDLLRNGGRNLSVQQLPPSVQGWPNINRAAPEFVDEVEKLLKGTSQMDAEGLRNLYLSGTRSDSGRTRVGYGRSDEAQAGKDLARGEGGIEEGMARELGQSPAAMRRQLGEGADPNAARAADDVDAEDAVDAAAGSGVPRRTDTPQQIDELAGAAQNASDDAAAMGVFSERMSAQAGREMTVDQIMALFQDMNRSQQETIRVMAQAMGSQRVTVKQVNQQTVDTGLLAGGRRTSARARQAGGRARDGLPRRKQALRRAQGAGNDADIARLQGEISRLEEIVRRSDATTTTVRNQAGWRALIPGAVATGFRWGRNILVGGLVLGAGYLIYQWLTGPDADEVVERFRNETIQEELLEGPAARLATVIQAAIAALRAVEFTPTSTGDTETGNYIQFLEDRLLPAATAVSQDGNTYVIPEGNSTDINNNSLIISGEGTSKTDLQHSAMQPGAAFEADVVAGDESDFITAEDAVEALKQELDQFNQTAIRVLTDGMQRQATDNANLTTPGYNPYGGGGQVGEGAGGGGRGGAGAGLAGRRDDGGGRRRNEIALEMDLWGETFRVVLPARSRRVGGQRVSTLRSDIAEKLGDPPPDGTRAGPIYRALNTDIGREYVGLDENNNPQIGGGHSDWSNIMQSTDVRLNDATSARISLAIQRMARYNIDSVRELRRDLLEDSRDQLGQGLFNTSPAYRDERRSLRAPTRESRRQERRDRRRRRRESRRRADSNLEHLHKISNKKSLYESTNIDDLIGTKRRIESNMSFNKKADEHSNEYFRGAVKGLNDSSAKTYYAGFKDMYNERPEKRPKDANSLYMTGDETGSELVQRAHPKSVVVSDAMGRGGLVENLLEQHRHGEEVAFSTPTGNYRSKHAFVLDELKGLAKKARSENNAEAFEMIKSAMVEIVSLTQS